MHGFPLGSLGISLLRRASRSFFVVSRKLTTALTSSSLRQSKDVSTVLARSSLLRSLPSTTADDVDMNKDLKHLFHSTRIGIVCITFSEKLSVWDKKNSLNFESPTIFLSIPHAIEWLVSTP